MKNNTQRQVVLSFRVQPELKTWIELTAARWTTKRKRRVSLTDVIEAAIVLLRKAEGK